MKVIKTLTLILNRMNGRIPLTKMVFVVILFLGYASAFAQKSPLTKVVTISFNNITLEKSLKLLGDQTGISFAYNSNLSQFKHKVNKSYKDRSVKYILSNLLNKENLGYKRIGDKITIYTTKDRKNKLTISGYVYDDETGEVLIGCNVYDKSTHSGLSTNQFGFYSLTLPVSDDARTIVFSYLGYKKQEIVVKAEGLQVDVRLGPIYDQLETVVVTAQKKEERQEIIRSSEVGKVVLNADEIRAIPPIGGEIDLLKAITVLPGIKPGVDGSSGFYVRGGSIDQNLILLDGVPIYNPYHMWGYLSSFNADAINNVEITKGAFPARYGGRLSSVVDITMKEGGNQEWHGDFSLGLLSAKASVSGPVVKDKSSLMFTVRRTFADLIIFPITNSKNSFDNYKLRQGYSFIDLNLKFNYKLSPKDRLYFSGFLSRDKYHYRQTETQSYLGTKFTTEMESGQGWGNAIASIRWNHLFSDNMFVNTTAYYSSYNYYLNDLAKRTSDAPDVVDEKENSVEYFSNIADLTIKQDYQYFPSNRHSVRFGFGAIYHEFKPGVKNFASKTGTETIDNTTTDNYFEATEISTYVEDDWDLSRAIRLNAGLHFSAFFVEGISYTSLQPRFSARFSLSERASLKVGYAQMTQYLHLLTTTGITRASDLWVPATKNIKPQRSEQYSLGTAISIGERYMLEVEGYYKAMDDVIEYREGASFLVEGTTLEDQVAVGSGNAYGGELLLKKTTGKLTGFLGYTLSWSNRKFEYINFGKEFPFRYDRRHDVSLVGNYRFNDKWSLNGAWVFYTGNAVSIPTSSYVTPLFGANIVGNMSFPDPYTSYLDVGSNGIVLSAPERNNYRLPNYHRLDVTATFTKSKPWGRWELTFGITNLYNKMNPSFYYITEENDLDTGETRTVYHQRTLFPFMPTLSYRILF